MKIEALRRTFAYNAIELADPGAALTPAAVKDFYTSVYPDLTNAEIEGPKVVGNTHAYTFRRAVGTKGADNADVHVICIAEANMARVFEEWAKRYAADPSGFMAMCDADGNVIESYGQHCTRYFKELAAELGV